MTGFPSVEDLLPHSRGMVWLHRVLEHTEKTTVCAADIDERALIRMPDGSVPSWVGIELMAQCLGVHGGLVMRERGDTVKRGLFVGSRSITFHADAFDPGRMLRVTARHLRGERGLVSFECAIHDESGRTLLAEGRLNVYILDDSETDADAE